MRIDSDETGPAPASCARLPWVAPHYAKMRAGDAELGPNPDAFDDVFTKS